MAYSGIISLFIIIYFIRDQFDFSKVTKTKFLLLPVFCLYQFFIRLNIRNLHEIIMLLVAFVISIFIGLYQSKDFQIKSKTIPSTYFVLDKNNQKLDVYQKLLYSKGGKSYLIGWIIMFLATLLFSGSFSWHLFPLIHELTDEIIKDLSIFARIKDNHEGWISWEILGFANIAYLFFIGKKSHDIRSLFASIFY